MAELNRKFRSPFDLVPPSSPQPLPQPPSQPLPQPPPQQFPHAADSSALSFHHELLKVMEKLWADSNFEFAGNFAEGWGYDIYGADGRCGRDSCLVWKHVPPTYTVHLSSCCSCGNVGSSQMALLQPDGTVLLNDDCVPHLRSLRLVRAEAQEMSEAQRQEMQQLSLSAAGPQLQLQAAFRCCRPPPISSFAASLGVADSELRQLPVLVLLDELQLPAGGGGKRATRPSGRLDYSLIERRLMQSLSDSQGRLLEALKLLLLHALPELQRGGESPYTERHCKLLLLQLLLQQRTTCGRSCDPTAAAKEALSLLERGSSQTLRRGAAAPQQQQQQQQRQQLPEFPPPVPRLVGADLLRKLRDRAPALLQQLPLKRQLVVEQPTVSFHPHLLMIPGRSSLPQTLSYRDVPNCLFSIFELLLTPEAGLDGKMEELIDRVEPRAGLAAVCLRCLLQLKRGDLPAARQHMYSCRMAVDRICRGFPRNCTAASVQEALESRDCSWLFRARLAVQESQQPDARCPRPLGTAFLHDYPSIRYVFFPARFTPVQHMQGCYVEYSLCVNFVALAHALVVEVVEQLPKVTSLWRMLQSKQELEAQELFCLTLADEKLPEADSREKRQHVQLTHALLQRRLRDSAASAPEWQWLGHAKIRLLFHWLRELADCRQRWTETELSDCRELVQLFARRSESLDDAKRQLQKPQLLPEESRKLLKSLMSLHTKEIAQAFGVKRPSHAGGLGRHFLAVQLYACYCFDAGRKEEFRRVYEEFRTE